MKIQITIIRDKIFTSSLTSYNCFVPQVDGFTFKLHVICTLPTLQSYLYNMISVSNYKTIHGQKTLEIRYDTTATGHVIAAGLPRGQRVDSSGDVK